MALITCSDCGRIISMDARACPWCGRQKINPLEAILGTLIILVILAGVVSSLYYIQNPQQLHILVDALVSVLTRYAAL